MLNKFDRVVCIKTYLKVSNLWLLKYEKNKEYKVSCIYSSHDSILLVHICLDNGKYMRFRLPEEQELFDVHFMEKSQYRKMKIKNIL